MSAIAKIDKLQFREVTEDGEWYGRNKARGEKNLIVPFFAAKMEPFQDHLVP
jgi:hypothetical protein